VSSAVHSICDAGVAKAAECRSQSSHSKLVLATTILASSLAFIDGSVVNVGLPAIGETFHGGAEDLQWVINAYLLPLSALLLLGGAAGDRFGRARLLVAGTLLLVWPRSPALSPRACLGCFWPVPSKESVPHY
jgi:MFS family permease